jgi:hypothetical protein
VTRIIVSADMRGSDEQRILLDEEVRPEHMSDEHSASQLLERLGWAVTDAERAPALAPTSGSVPQFVGLPPGSRTWGRTAGTKHKPEPSTAGAIRGRDSG